MPHASPFRILDVNLNRAREGLRTAEEFARLTAGDEPNARALKQLRHTLDTLFRAPRLHRALLAARDVAHDVGAGLTLPGQNAARVGRASRAAAAVSPAAIATAACKRTQEALRNLEEFLPAAHAAAPTAALQKTLPQPAAVAKIRYALYDLERDLFTAHHRRALLTGRTLCLLWSPDLYRIATDRALAAALRGARDARRPNALLIQLRMKQIDDGALLRRAHATQTICERLGLPLILNDRPHVALHSGCDGVHLGQTDMAPALARDLLGPDKLIGLSTHSVAQIRAALKEPVDYLGLGPMFATRTKPELEPVGPALAKATQPIRRACPWPVFAIGGITAQNVKRLQPFHIRAAAVSGHVFAGATESSIRQAVANLLRAL